jgi:hypothetical protein
MRKPLTILKTSGLNKTDDSGTHVVTWNVGTLPKNDVVVANGAALFPPDFILAAKPVLFLEFSCSDSSTSGLRHIHVFFSFVDAVFSLPKSQTD